MVLALSMSNRLLAVWSTDPQGSICTDPLIADILSPLNPGVESFATSSGGLENQYCLGSPGDPHRGGSDFIEAAGFAIAVPRSNAGDSRLCAAARPRVWSMLARNPPPPRSVFHPLQHSLTSASQTTIQPIGYAVGAAAAGSTTMLAGLGAELALLRPGGGISMLAAFIPILCLAVLVPGGSR